MDGPINSNPDAETFRFLPQTKNKENIGDA